MSRTYRKNYLIVKYRNRDNYIKHGWDVEYYDKAHRDDNSEHWKKSYREETHEKMRAKDFLLLKKLKNDPEIFDEINMSHKHCVDIWAWV